MKLVERIYDTIWHWCFHLRHQIECRFTTRYDAQRRGLWKWVLR